MTALIIYMIISYIAMIVFCSGNEHNNTLDVIVTTLLILFAPIFIPVIICGILIVLLDTSE